MADAPDPRAVAAAWVPELPGRVAPRDVPDPIVEPDWGGLRCVAAITTDRASIHRYGDEIDVPAELLGSLTFAFNAQEAVIEGHLTTAAFGDGTGAFPATEHVDRPIFAIPSIFKRRNTDPFIFAGVHEARREAEAPDLLDALEAGERHAFVAVDILWLDGQALGDIPLLERKRLLDTVLRPSKLVRVTPFIRPASAPRTMLTWGTLGFEALSWKAANARYLEGRENPGWAVAPAPSSNSRPVK
jgi:ATP-dependent DNA ligase